MMIRVEDLYPSPYANARLNYDDLAELKASIKQNGIQVRPVVRADVDWVNQRITYYIINGHRVVRCAKELGMKTILVDIVHIGNMGSEEEAEWMAK